jgi:hypothetical protein
MQKFGLQLEHPSEEIPLCNDVSDTCVVLFGLYHHALQNYGML